MSLFTGESSSEFLKGTNSRFKFSTYVSSFFCGVALILIGLPQEAFADVSYTDRFKITYPQMPKLKGPGFNPFKAMMEPKIFKNYISGPLEVRHYFEHDHNFASIRNWKDGTYVVVDFTAREYTEAKLGRRSIPRSFSAMAEPGNCHVKFVGSKLKLWNSHKCDEVQTQTSCKYKGKDSKFDQAFLFCKDVPKELLDFKYKNLENQYGQGEAFIPNFLSTDWKRRVPKEFLNIANGKYSVQVNQVAEDGGMSLHMTLDLVGTFSTKDLDKKIFKVPAGFKKVSELKVTSMAHLNGNIKDKYPGR